MKAQLILFALTMGVIALEIAALIAVLNDIDDGVYASLNDRCTTALAAATPQIAGGKP